MLTDAQINRAYRLFYGEGMNLGEVMKELSCGLYDLTPWLTAPAIRIAGDAVQADRTETGRRALAEQAGGENA